ncbi:G1/S-specific cyclin Cln1 [Penicillium brasilianum]|uniref:G1/S-specific cyclin Cln1 n=1 Tax=Penicillium brasilianum TaxID=104259 RepID=A0A1S9RCA8_PENBI|nr:G1/S-specific cyclin Cln1 [Penicillium brasilianum]
MDYVRPRSGYQPCDTFFIEDDYRMQAEKQAKQEHDKLVARERQYAMANQLSRITCAEFRDDVLQQMLEMDGQTLPDVESIDIQTEIQWFMRPYLLDFLIEAHTAFQLLPSTLFLAINLLDRYCSKRVVYKRHYQLVGCAALLIAAKYNDKKDRVPTVKELKSMCCSLYDDDMFIQMEWHVLQTLGWSVGHPTVDEFLSIAIMDEPFDAEVEHMALYILEIALFYRDFVSKPSSELARAALALSRCILNRPQPRHTDWAAQYDSTTLVGLSQQLHQPSTVVARKYASSHFSRVSKILENFLSRQASLASYPRCTPPVETPVESKPYSGEMGLATPQKSQQLTAVPHGYMTPPITPENGPFAAQAHMAANQEMVRGIPTTHGCSPSPAPETEMQYMHTDAYQQQEAMYLAQQSQQLPPFPPHSQMAIDPTYSAVM